jgi:hypothetical protein
MDQLDQFQTQFGLCPVLGTFGLNGTLLGPPQPRRNREAESSLTDLRYGDDQPDDDKTQAESDGHFSLHYGGIMLKSSATYLPPPVLIERVVYHSHQLGYAEHQGLNDQPKNHPAHAIACPNRPGQEMIQTGVVPLSPVANGQNHPTDGVLAYGKHPSGHHEHKMLKAGAAEAPSKISLVNSEIIWQVFSRHGVPPLVFSPSGIYEERRRSSTSFTTHTLNY